MVSPSGHPSAPPRRAGGRSRISRRARATREGAERVHDGAVVAHRERRAAEERARCVLQYGVRSGRSDPALRGRARHSRRRLSQDRQRPRISARRSRHSLPGGVLPSVHRRRRQPTRGVSIQRPDDAPDPTGRREVRRVASRARRATGANALASCLARERRAGSTCTSSTETNRSTVPSIGGSRPSCTAKEQRPGSFRR